MANVNVRPLGDRVLVKPLDPAETKKGGIIIPDTAKEKPQEGEIVALGTGKRDDDGGYTCHTFHVEPSPQGRLWVRHPVRVTVGAR